MKALAQRLRRDKDEIIAMWQATASTEPWVLLPEHDRVDFLPHVLDGLARIVEDHPVSQEAMQLLADTALQHGHDRQALGVPDQVIFAEYDLLRRAIWRYLRELDLPGGEDAMLILRLDAAISFATRASLLGYHRLQLERQGRWEDALRKLAEETALRWAR